MTGMTNVTKLASEPSGREFLVFTLVMKSTVLIF